MTDPAPYSVFPTQPWQVCEAENGVQHIQPPAAQGGAWLGSYVYLFTRTSDDQMYTQRILIQASENTSAPWITFLQGDPFPVADFNGAPLSSQSPPAAITSNDLIFLLYPGPSGDQRIFMTRFDGSTFALENLAFPDQFVATSLPVCVATLDSRVFLAWPGAGYNGYFYSVGTIGTPDSFGATIQWGDTQLIPGTQSWVMVDTNGNPSVMPFKTDTASGFIFFTEHFFPNTLSYFVYDNAKNEFTSQQALPFPWPAENPPGYTVTGSALSSSSNLVIPILMDQVGNLTYYQLDDSNPNYGSFADWLQCAIGGQGPDIGVSVGIPPSISISGDIDTSPTPELSAMMTYPGQSGAALICGQFYDPFIGDNKLGYAGVALNVGTMIPP